MSEYEHDDGRCCENGYRGQTHDCRKGKPPEQAPAKCGQHSWITCHGVTYCRDCDEKPAPVGKTMTGCSCQYPNSCERCWPSVTQAQIDAASEPAPECPITTKAVEATRSPEPSYEPAAESAGREFSEWLETLDSELVKKYKDCVRTIVKVQNELTQACGEREKFRAERNEARAEVERLGKEVEELMKIDYWQDRHNIVAKELAAVKARASSAEAQTTEMRKACANYPSMVDQALAQRDRALAAVEYAKRALQIIRTGEGKEKFNAHGVEDCPDIAKQALAEIERILAGK